MTDNKPVLLECPFERGQVWSNPDDRIMLVVSVLRDFRRYEIVYVSEDGETGSFYTDNKAVVDNCVLMNTPAPSTLQRRHDELVRVVDRLNDFALLVRRDITEHDVKGLSGQEVPVVLQLETRMKGESAIEALAAWKGEG